MSDPYAINPDDAQRLLAEAMAKIGPLAHAKPVPAPQLLALEGRMPELLLALWSDYGSGDLLGGRLQICPPHRFDAVIAHLFGSEPDMAGACQVFAMTAFGELIAWHERHWLIHISPVRAWVLAPQMLHPERKVDANMILHAAILAADPAAFDLYDTDGAALFDRARAKFGPLRPGLIWGMFPVPPVPEEVRLDNLRLVLPEDYLTEVVSQQTLTLQDFEGERFNLRGFGGLR